MRILVRPKRGRVLTEKTAGDKRVEWCASKTGNEEE